MRATARKHNAPAVMPALAIAALTGSDVDGSTNAAIARSGSPGAEIEPDGGLAVAAVLSYRAFAYWMPLIPGVPSYVRLQRTATDWERKDRLQSRAAS